MEMDVIRRDRQCSDNIIHKLFEREAGFKKEPNHCVELPLHYPFDYSFYKSIVPNCTIQNIAKPNCFFRKFTPDGQLLLGISNDQKSVEVWKYKSVGYVANDVKVYTNECIFESQIQPYELGSEPYSMFDTIFSKKWSIRLVQDNLSRCHVNREFSIFFDIDSVTYVLMVAVSLSLNGHGAEIYFRYPDICDDFDLFHYNFHLINLQTGTIADTKRYNNDYIVLTHNHGVSVYNRTIAILSMHRQCVMLLEIADGHLIPIYEVGPFANALDELRITSVPTKFDSANNDMAFSHLKQKILAYLYNDINEIEDLEERKLKLRAFYRKFRILERMYISKIQLITPECLLLRYEDRTPAVPMERNSVIENDFKLYIFYSLESSEIIRIYEKDSVDLLNLLRDYCDVFRNIRSVHTRRPPSSISNNICYRDAFDSAIGSCGNLKDAALRFNPTLPISTQSFSTSPYLDYTLFNYDDRLLSSLERPKFVTPDPIVFTDRQTNKVKFRLFLFQQFVCNTWIGSTLANNGNDNGNGRDTPGSDNSQGSNNGNANTDGNANANANSHTSSQNGNIFITPAAIAAAAAAANAAATSNPSTSTSNVNSISNMSTNSRDVVFFIFHPFEPFIISMQKYGIRHVLNFHLYNPSTIVNP